MAAKPTIQIRRIGDIRAKNALVMNRAAPRRRRDFPVIILRVGYFGSFHSEGRRGARMSGEIIEFRTQRELRRGRLYRNQAVPRAPSLPTARRPAATIPRWSQHPPSVADHLLRIAVLLEELSELTREPGEVPNATRQRARTLVEKARDVLQRWPERVAPADDEDVDPQPHLDSEILERMYRHISPESPGD